MALTLRESVDAEQTYLELLGADALRADSIYSIDDEWIYVRGVYSVPGHPTYRQLTVERAFLGTAAAAHTRNAALAVVTLGAGGAGGGGITNTAPAGSVAVSDGTDITGSANLTWDDVGNVLGLAAAENGGGTIEAIGVGGQLFIRAHAGDATHVGGEVSITSGASNGYNGGSISVKTGDDTGGGDAGGIVIETGFATDGASGDIDIRVDPNDLSGTGGNVLIQAGTGQTGSGGDVFISAGSAVTSGTNGSVQILDGSGHSIEMNPSGMFLLGGVVILDSLPTADPVNAGQVWNDTGTLKVSAG
jgi:hypothetical protein